MELRWVAKLAGSVCIMGACVLTGQMVQLRLKKRYQLLSEMQETLRYLQKEMTYRRSSVCESLRSASGRCHTELGKILSAAARSASQRNGESFQKIWEASVQQYLPEGIVSEEERQLLLETSGALCNSDTALQNTMLEQYADRFSESSRLACESYREKGSLYRKLTGAAGIFLILLLW